MPCSDSSSSMTIQLDAEERFISFEYAKITCGQDIKSTTGLNRIFVGKPLEEIIQTSFAQVASQLDIKDEENQFVLYLEWDALRSAIGLYLGVEDQEIDTERCLMTSIAHNQDTIEIALVILPPAQLPKILPCSMGKES